MFRKAQRLIKNAIYWAYCISINKPQGIVLMLHRVIPNHSEESCIKSIQELCITPQKLQIIIENYRRDYDFIQLNELETRLLNPEKNNRPFVVFTLDDGYLDNYENAFPIFVKNKVPFSVFVTVDFIGNSKPFNYPYLLDKIINNNTSLDINGLHYYCRTYEEKESTFLALKNYVLSLPYSNFKESFYSIFDKYITDSSYGASFMTWKQLKEMQNSGYCVIGSHTMSHCRLSNCREDSQLSYELGESKRIIEENLNHKINYISYPFGWINDIDDRVIEIAKKKGYTMAFISHGGECRKMDNDLFRIKRLMVK